MIQEMRTDAELLNAILDDAPQVIDRVTGDRATVTAKLLAYWTGRAVQTISDYRNGRINIPIEVWRLILVHWLNAQIVALILPDGVEAELTTVPAIPPANAQEFLCDAIEAEGRHHEKQMYFAAIIADGQIDKLDDNAIAAYDAAYQSHRVNDAELHASIIAAHKLATTGERCR